MSRDQTHLVRQLLDSGRRVVALLASEYPAAFHPLSDAEIADGLFSLGFAAVETTTLGEELVGDAYERLHARRDALLSIRSTCPVVVEYVRSFYPAFVPALAPVVPAYVAQARLIRALNPEDVAIVYASPCHARKHDALSPGIAGAVDAVIGLDELSLLAKTSRRRPGSAPGNLPRVHQVLRKEVSAIDGFPRRTLAERRLTDTCVAVVRGSAELGRLLAAVVAGDAGPSVIDALECAGCLDGPAIPDRLPLYARRTLVATRADVPDASRVSSRAVLRALPAVDLVRSFSDAAPLAGEGGATAADLAATSDGDGDGRLRTVLEHELARSQRYGDDVSLVLIAVVTRPGMPGHDGIRVDRVIDALADVLRTTDVIAPWPPHGIALLLPATGKTAAFAVAEKLRAHAAERLVEGGYTPDVGASLSFGIASAGPAARDATTLITAATGVLADAVAGGPGQVRLAAG